MTTERRNTFETKNGLGRFSIYLIHLYSHGEAAAIEVKSSNMVAMVSRIRR